MNDATPIPFDPDFDEPSTAVIPSSARPYFIFGVVVGLTAAAMIGVILILSS